MLLDKLEEIKNLREVWPHEALDFTRWLAEEENLELLGSTIGIDLEDVEVESAVGDFHVDIFASSTNAGQKVIIENQLECTNHDHLGKLITYASGKSANVIVWLVRHAREEHRSAIEWLNNHTDDDIGFFLCEIKLYRIGNSAPAVKFEIIEKPNDWSKAVKKNDLHSGTRQRRLEYWEAFNDYAAQSDAFMRNFTLRKPSGDHWMDLSVGSSKFHICICQIRRQNLITIELYIPDDKSTFYELLEHRDMIEAETGLKFDWQELPNKNASRIRARRKADFDDRSSWSEQFSWIINSAVKLKAAVKQIYN